MNRRKNPRLMLLILLGIIFPSAIFAAPGDFDLSFGSGGKVLTQIGASKDFGEAAALQPDGKIIVAGRNSSQSVNRLVVVRTNPDGSLDGSFGDNGKVIVSYGSSFYAFAVIVQPDGKIIAGGLAASSSAPVVLTFTLVRLNSNGSVDTTCGANGFAQTVFGTDRSQIHSLAVQPDGKIVAAGFTYTDNSDSPISFAIARYNTDGSPDNTFDGDGKLQIVYPGFDSGAYSVLIQPDGKILVGGFADLNIESFRLVRLNTDGSLDSGFGVNGNVATQFPNAAAQFPVRSRIGALALQPDGKIVAAGHDFSFHNQVAIARYNPDGSLDNTFGGDGQISTVITGKNVSITGVGIQNDGKIVVGGNLIAPDFTDVRFAAFRYNADGSLDTGFDADGIVTTDVSPFRDFSGETLVQSNGKIILAGYSNSGLPTAAEKITLVRYNSDGSLDASFDGDGINLVNISSSNSLINDVAVQPDGKIVAVGYSLSPRESITLARYNSNGTLDNTFGNGGIVVSTFPGIFTTRASSVVIQPDGKILVVGDYYSGSVIPYADFVVLRYNADGSPDTSFGTSSGKTVFSIGSFNDIASSIALQADGKIVVGGTRVGGDGPNSTNVIAVARLTANGFLDGSFDGDGIVTTAVRNKFDGASDLAIQADGKIVVAGSASNAANTENDFALVRYNADGSLDTTFDGDGKLTTSFAASGISNEEATAVKIQSDGKIVASGTSDGKFAVARYNSDGSLDNSFDGDGKLTTLIGSASEGSDLAIQPNGKLIVVGSSTINSNVNAAIARYNSNGSLDNSFGAGGIVITPVADLNDGLRAVALQADGKIVAGGYGIKSTYTDFALVRYQGGDANATRPMFDFDGDRKTDISVFRNGVWHLQRSQIGFAALNWGVASDVIAPADFDGDGKTDLTVYRPSNGEWSVFNSLTHSIFIVRFGAPDDLPRPADYDGDGKADICVWRPSNGVWYRLNSSNGQFAATAFGQAGDVPLIADFDGDGRSDISVFRPSNGVWYWIRSSDNQFAAIAFGAIGDKPVAADYDGDGKTDVAAFRPSNGVWYRINSQDNSFYALQFGQSGDAPTLGDYDGDGRADIAVFRPSNGVWYLQQTSNGFTGIAFGASGDRPIPNAFVP